jgi:hypothetical protein
MSYRIDLEVFNPGDRLTGNHPGHAPHELRDGNGKY